MSAVGLRVRSPQARPLHALLTGELQFDQDRKAQVKVKVVWTSPEGQGHLLGLEIVEAGREFYEALPWFSPDET